MNKFHTKISNGEFFPNYGSYSNHANLVQNGAHASFHMSIILGYNRSKIRALHPKIIGKNLSGA